MAASLPSSARCVIVGGGVVGASVAYNLSRKGWKNIILLEAQKVTSGTTWHAAGLVGTTRNTSAETKLCVMGTQLYDKLLDDTGIDPGFKRCSSVNVARTPERMHLLHRVANKTRSYGLDSKILTSDEILEEFTNPTDGVCAFSDFELLGGIKVFNDGSGSPTDLTMSLLAGAKQRGVEVFENVRIADFLSRTDSHNGGKVVTGVRTENDVTIDADVVVMCAGQWSRQLGKKSGVNVPLQSAEHFYATTNTIPGIWSGMPVLRDPDALIYVREWGDGLLFGGFENGAKPWGAYEDGDVPENFEFSLLQDDWDHFMPLFEGALERVPALENAQLKMLNGPESFTPDGQYILGEAPEMKNFYVAAGMNSSGIASAGGAGLALADWIDDGEPKMDLGPVDIRRFHKSSGNPSFLRDRTIETLSLHYSFPWPRKELNSARGLRRSSLYPHLDKAGAMWGSKFGWERPLFFRPDEKDRSETLEDMYTFERPKWLKYVDEEVRSCREDVAVFDQSSFAKIRVEGPDALKFLQRLCCGNLDVEVGRIVYTGMLNSRGAYEADVTVTREGENKFFVVSPTAQATKDLSYMKRLIRKDESVYANDVSSSYCVLGVMGPKSRSILQSLMARPEVLTDENFKFNDSRTIDVGYHNVTAKRITYVGELGYELYVPTEEAVDVYEALINSGAKNAGYFAVESMRIEKGYRAFGHELTPSDSPVEAGLMFTVDMSKEFIGKKAVKAMNDEKSKIHRRLFTIIIRNDPDLESRPTMLWGGEVILMGGKPVGDLLSATYCSTVKSCVGMGYVNHERVFEKGFTNKHEWSLMIGERTLPCSLQIRCAYDSKGEKIRY